MQMIASRVTGMVWYDMEQNYLLDFLYVFIQIQVVKNDGNKQAKNNLQYVKCQGEEHRLNSRQAKWWI